MTLPFDDKDMFYDKNIRQYVLNPTYVLNTIFLDKHVEVELRSNNRFKRLLYEVSDDIYRFIYRYTVKHQIPVKRYLLAKREEIRDVLKRAMLYQIRYYLRSGGGLLKDMTGVDLERSRTIDINRLRGEGKVASDTIDILHEIPEILYSGRLYLNIRDLEDGTY